MTTDLDNLRLLLQASQSKYSLNTSEVNMDIVNDNTSVGILSLPNTATGIGNIAIGQETLSHSTSSAHNSAVGSTVLNSTTTGSDNTVIGYKTMIGNTTGNGNTCIGSLSLQVNDGGNDNVVIGYNSGISLVNGDGNTCVGSHAGNGLSSSSSNSVSLGMNAGRTSQHGESIIINASPSVLNSLGTQRFYVRPVREISTQYGMFYNPTSKEISHGKVRSVTETLDVATFICNDTHHILIANSTTGLQTISLPDPDVSNSGVKYIIYKAGNAGNVIVTTDSGLSLFDQTIGGSTIVLSVQNDKKQFISTGSFWMVL